jgi:hypothetical protein
MPIEKQMTESRETGLFLFVEQHWDPLLGYPLLPQYQEKLLIPF